MRRRGAVTAVLAAVLIVVLAAPVAAAGATKTAYGGFTFPFGWPLTGTTCPGEFITTPIRACVVDPGSTTQTDGGPILIRHMTTMSMSLTFVDGAPYPATTGYMLTDFSANLSSPGNGPAWGTWTLYDLVTNEPIWVGSGAGMFVDWGYASHFVARGVGTNQGLHLTGVLHRVDDPFNTYGEVMQPGH